MPETLERIYDEHAQALFSFLLNFTRSEMDSRDVLQEVFCKIVARPGILEGARDERAFLLRLSHNLAVDLMRRRSTREKVNGQLANEGLNLFAASQDADEERLRGALSEALKELPPEQRAVAHLKLWEGATFGEIGKALGISANTAASRYRYAIDKLRRQLRPIYKEIKS
jgi:RNA polymerase sigma-70 factor (ECF subfamily)